MVPETAANPEFLDAGGVATLLGVSTATINRLRLYRPENSPPFLKVAGRVVYPRVKFDAWVASRLEGGK